MSNTGETDGPTAAQGTPTRFVTEKVSENTFSSPKGSPSSRQNAQSSGGGVPPTSSPGPQTSIIKKTVPDGDCTKSSKGKKKILRGATYVKSLIFRQENVKNERFFFINNRETRSTRRRIVENIFFFLIHIIRRENRFWFFTDLNFPNVSTTATYKRRLKGKYLFFF